MSENLDLVRSIYAAGERGDFSDYIDGKIARVIPLTEFLRQLPGVDAAALRRDLDEVIDPAM